jgi:hypothetical protein
MNKLLLLNFVGVGVEMVKVVMVVEMVKVVVILCNHLITFSDCLFLSFSG